MDRDTVRPPLRQHIQLATNGKTRPKAFQRLIEQRSLAAFQRKKEQRHRCHESIGKRSVEAVEEEVAAVIDALSNVLCLIKISLDGRSNSSVAAFVRSPIIKDACTQRPQVPPH